MMATCFTPTIEPHMTKQTPLLFLALALHVSALAQISHGGFPWLEGARPEPIVLPQLDLERLSAEDAITDVHKDIPWRYGVEHEVNWNAEDLGNWAIEQDHLVWRLAIDGAQSTCLAVRFSTFDLPKGGQLFLHAPDGAQVIGALDHRNMKPWGGLSTDLIMGDDMVIEYRQPLALNAAPSLVIDQVIQGYRPLSGWMNARGPGDSGDCNINVNCPEGATWQTEKRSVALILAGGGICTGALINNTSNDGTPYFLTANHCLGNPQNWVYRFNFESANCNGNNGPTNQSVSGGSLLVSSAQSDFALLELSQTPPASYDVQYAGWDASGATPVNTVGIHHPSGDVKKICFDDDSPTQQNQGGAAVWYISAWEEGVTEGGSSGSPLFDQNHRIIGQLYGGFAACAGAVNNGQADWYGRLGTSWGLGLQAYLDPLNLGLEIWDGFPDGAAVYDNDAGVNITDAPNGVLCGSQQVEIEVTLTNTGQNTLTSCMLEYSINNGPTLQQSWAGSLAPFQSELVTLPPFTPAGGENSIEVNVITPNGVNDKNGLNNATTATFTASEGPTFTYTLELVLDDFGSETSWSLRRFGEVLYEGGPYTNGTAGTLISAEFCLEEGCYQFRIEDEYDDGICCDFGEGSWTLLDPNGVVVGTGGQFTVADNLQFCADESLGLTDQDVATVRAYPVPANDFLTVTWPASEGQVRVMDNVGRTVMNEAVFSPQSTWSTSTWSEGTYLIDWRGAEGTRKLTRISVIH